MYILLAMIAACVLGIALHFSLPHRDLRGVILTPGLTVLASAACYAILTWLQWGEANIWLWVVSLAAPLVLSGVITVVVGSLRARSDDAERRRAGLAR